MSSVRSDELEMRNYIRTCTGFLSKNQGFGASAGESHQKPCRPPLFVAANMPISTIGIHCTEASLRAEKSPAVANTMHWIPFSNDPEHP